MKKEKKMILGVCICAVFAAAVMFLPSTLQAGNLEPPGAPAPTMKTLDEIPPAWSQKLQCDTTACPRFKGVFPRFAGGIFFGYAAYLDRETGLVWERSPSTTTVIWSSALAQCTHLSVGGRKGWHLPTIEQLLSLVDPTQTGPGLALPSGHPFVNVQDGDQYWSANTVANTGTIAMTVHFSNGNMGGDGKDENHYKWCVRGGQSHDAWGGP